MEEGGKKEAGSDDKNMNKTKGKEGVMDKLVAMMIEEKKKKEKE